jgi:hypothetical protein
MISSGSISILDIFLARDFLKFELNGSFISFFKGNINECILYNFFKDLLKYVIFRKFGLYEDILKALGEYNRTYATKDK